MWIVLLLSVIQCLLLTCGQVLLKIALARMGAFSWSWQFFGSVLTNWYFLGCGICFAAGSLLWMYILKHYPLSIAYPMASLSYVFALLSAIIIFHEQVSVTQWIGVALIMAGCCLIVK